MLQWASNYWCTISGGKYGPPTHVSHFSHTCPSEHMPGTGHQASFIEQFVMEYLEYKLVSKVNYPCLLLLAMWICQDGDLMPPRTSSAPRMQMSRWAKLRSLAYWPRHQLASFWQAAQSTMSASDQNSENNHLGMASPEHHVAMSRKTNPNCCQIWVNDSHLWLWLKHPVYGCPDPRTFPAS